MTRRANGEGSRPTPRADGSWSANYTDRQGLRRTVYGRTAELCRANLADRIRERDTGAAARIDRRSTVAAVLARWVGAIDRTPGTRAQYAHIIKTQIVPSIGRLKLVELDRDDVRGMMRDLEDRGLAPATRRTALTVLRMALNDALGDGRVARNVAALAEMPSLTRAADDMYVPPTAPQLRALLALLQAEDDALYPLYVLAAHLGLRQGELVGLRWSAVDLDAGVIHVTAAWNRTAGAMGVPKTARGVRDLRLWPEAVAMLQAAKSRQLREGRATREGFVFTSSRGRLRPQTLGEHFRAAQARAGIAPEGGRLDHFRFHDIRHAVATIMLEAGRSPAAVQAVMGHASIAVTVNLYGHVKPAAEDTSAMVHALG